MQRIIELDEPFERVEKSHDEAVKICLDLQQPLKAEHIQTELKNEKSLSFYQQGEFVDLCRGPHIPSPKVIGAFKILSIAGAYWKGDESRQQLQRLYATAFFSKQDLEQHLERIEEAKKRDHRVLGKRLGLFHIDDMVGQGLILWTPKGAFIRQTTAGFHFGVICADRVTSRSSLRISANWSCTKPVDTFPITKRANIHRLVQREHLQALAAEGCTCGELSNKMAAGEIDGYLLKPMNCPHHIKIYSAAHRSYRDLPIRLAEFGTVYRWEQSGEIGGLTRVRGFTQDDAHLFVTQEQVAAELAGCLELVKIVFSTMGMEDYRVRLGLRDPASDKYVGKPENWELAEQACRDAAKSLGKDFTEEKGEAAFYGPKIDFVVRDCIGRQWQLGTVQVDYNLPERFGLEYIGPDNRPHRPVMIHRAPFGSMERFIGVLIEHFAGAFPLWLCPEQARVVTVSEKSEEFGRQVLARLRETGIRAEGDFRSEKLGAKIRDGQLEMIPYMLVVGPRDVEAQTVSVRDRVSGDLGAMPVEALVEKLVKEIAEKALRPVSKIRIQRRANLKASCGLLTK